METKKIPVAITLISIVLLIGVCGAEIATRLPGYGYFSWNILFQGKPFCSTVESSDTHCIDGNIVALIGNYATIGNYAPLSNTTLALPVNVYTFRVVGYFGNFEYSTHATQSINITDQQYSSVQMELAQNVALLHVNYTNYEADVITYNCRLGSGTMTELLQYVFKMLWMESDEQSCNITFSKEVCMSYYAKLSHFN
jgi:hypothetical protein